MKVLIACDKFKGSLDALKVCKSIASGLQQAKENISIEIQPLADGGDGTLQVLQSCYNYKLISVDTIDPLHRKIKANYLSDGNVAYIELAEASGIVRLKNSEYDVLSTTTIGTGNLIKHALQNSHNEIILSVGGSCSNDVGLGIAYALGFSFLDFDNNILIPCGSNLHLINKIIKPIHPIADKVTILCDVQNTLFGEDGAAHIFGPQKGASTSDIILLDKGMIHISNLIKQEFKKDISLLKGGGAAGGVPAGLFGLLNDIHIKNGFNYISELSNLEEKIKSSDLVITGEGQLDRQSLQGKVIGRISSLCYKNDIPLIAVVGLSKISQNEKKKLGLQQIHEILSIAKNQEDAIQNCEFYLNEIGRNLLKNSH